jgi:8-oxo-dGTP pyrophosphatase MutT (NUDIX family)
MKYPGRDPIYSPANRHKNKKIEQTMKLTPMKTLRALMEPISKRPDYVQTAALCLREGKTGREVLLVSSLQTRRWILPKGWPMEGHTLAGAALQEAWEEAGVVGRVAETPVGYYTYEKVLKGGLPVGCRVEVFRVDVSDLARDYPEQSKRKRKWATPADAAELVDEPELKALLRSL